VFAVLCWFIVKLCYTHCVSYSTCEYPVLGRSLVCLLLVFTVSLVSRSCLENSSFVSFCPLVCYGFLFLYQWTTCSLHSVCIWVHLLASHDTTSLTQTPYTVLHHLQYLILSVYYCVNKTVIDFFCITFWRVAVICSRVENETTSVSRSLFSGNTGYRHNLKGSLLKGNSHCIRTLWGMIYPRCHAEGRAYQIMAVTKYVKKHSPFGSHTHVFMFVCIYIYIWNVYMITVMIEMLLL